jgi:hypothetical protein
MVTERPPGRWCIDLATEVETHVATLRIRPVQLAPQIAGLLQDLGEFLGDDRRLYHYAATILSEAWSGITRGEPSYQTARNAAASGHKLPPPKAAEQLRLCARWHTDDVVTALIAALWVARRLLDIDKARRGRVESRWADTFLAATESRKQQMRAEWRRGRRGY